MTGIDAAEPLVEIARERVPDGDLRVGDLQFLPFADDAFDVVTGFNSFQYAADPIAALAEAKRVAKPESQVFVLVWGRQDRTEIASILSALRPLVPPGVKPWSRRVRCGECIYPSGFAREYGAFMEHCGR